MLSVGNKGPSSYERSPKLALIFIPITLVVEHAGVSMLVLLGEYKLITIYYTMALMFFHIPELAR
jgi:hypothetical protein